MYSLYRDIHVLLFMEDSAKMWKVSAKCYRISTPVDEADLCHFPQSNKICLQNTLPLPGSQGQGHQKWSALISSGSPWPKEYGYQIWTQYMVYTKKLQASALYARTDIQVDLSNTLLVISSGCVTFWYCCRYGNKDLSFQSNIKLKKTTKKTDYIFLKC